MGENVVALHLNKERGQGIKLAKRFGVESLPTYLILDAEGNELERFGGYSPPMQFIASMKAILAGESFSDLQKKVDADPNDRRSAYRLAMRYIYRMDLDAARPLLVRVADPANPDEELRLAAEVNLAVLASQEEQTMEPLEAFVAAYPESPFASEIAMYLYQGYADGGQVDQAIGAAELAIELGPPSEDVVFLGKYLLFLADQGVRSDRVRDLIGMTVELAPDSPEVHDRAANAFKTLGDMESALRSAQRAVAVAGKTERKKYELRLAKLREASGSEAR